TYEKIRYLGKWEESYGGTEDLLKERDRRGLKYPVIICQFSLMEENEHEVEDYRKYWQARGAEDGARLGPLGSHRPPNRFPHCLPLGQQHHGDPPGWLGGGLRR